MSIKGRRFILKQTVRMGIGTLLSRFFGLLREVLMARFLGAGAVADAFNVAFVMPNTLRKIFAEGALTAALGPTIVSVVRKGGKEKVSELVTLTFGIIQAFLLLLCIMVSLNAQSIVWFTAPGFSVEQQLYTAGFAQVLIYYILFVSAASLIATVLISLQRFFMPTYGQVFMNILFVLELGLCLYFKLSVMALAYFVLLNGAIILLMYFFSYFSAGLSFVMPSKETWQQFALVMHKFIPGLITAGSMEISLYVDRTMASYLPAGSISLLTWAWAFSRVPLGVVAGAFATILLPSMSHLAIYARRRLGFYLLEAAKLIAWVMIPVTVLAMVLAYKVFYTLLLSDKFSIIAVTQGAQLFAAFSSGLFFFSLNKILTNIFYAVHDILRPTIIVLISTVFNTILNVILMRYWGVLGIVIATVCATVLQTLLLVVVLSRHHNVFIYLKQFAWFIARVFVQVAFCGMLLYILYGCMQLMIVRLPLSLSVFLRDKIGFWLWFGPMTLAIAGLMYGTRKNFGVRLYFLD